MSCLRKIFKQVFDTFVLIYLSGNRMNKTDLFKLFAIFIEYRFENRAYRVYYFYC